MRIFSNLFLRLAYLFAGLEKPRKMLEEYSGGHNVSKAFISLIESVYLNKDRATISYGKLLNALNSSWFFCMYHTDTVLVVKDKSYTNLIFGLTPGHPRVITVDEFNYTYIIHHGKDSYYNRVNSGRLERDTFIFVDCFSKRFEKFVGSYLSIKTDEI